MSPIPQNQPEVIEVDIPVPGEDRYRKVDYITRQIEDMLTIKGVTHAEALAVVSALMANAIIQTVPQRPCLFLQLVVGAVVHDQIHYQLGDDAVHH